MNDEMNVKRKFSAVLESSSEKRSYQVLVDTFTRSNKANKSSRVHTDTIINY